MNTNATATFDAGDARGPGHGLISTMLRAAHSLTRLLAPSARTQQDDAAAVRALADSCRHSDPGFAADLYAAAARYEAERDAQAAAAR
jgi:hypothetical protein